MEPTPGRRPNTGYRAPGLLPRLLQRRLGSGSCAQLAAQAEQAVVGFSDRLTESY